MLRSIMIAMQSRHENPGGSGRDRIRFHKPRRTFTDEGGRLWCRSRRQSEPVPAFLSLLLRPIDSPEVTGASPLKTYSFGEKAVALCNTGTVIDGSPESVDD